MVGKKITGGGSLTNQEASIILGMLDRGDHNHHIACYFGVNPARIAEVKDGSHGVSMAPPADLPFKGPAGLKGRSLRRSVDRALNILNEKGADGLAEVRELLVAATARYDRDET